MPGDLNELTAHVARKALAGEDDSLSGLFGDVRTPDGLVVKSGKDLNDHAEADAQAWLVENPKWRDNPLWRQAYAHEQQAKQPTET